MDNKELTHLQALLKGLVPTPNGQAYTAASPEVTETVSDLKKAITEAPDRLDEMLSKVQKALDTTAGTTGLYLIRENLSNVITSLTGKETPIRDRLPRKTGAGLAAAWNVLESIGTGNSPHAEGATPTENTTAFGRRTAAYKELGKKKTITDRMLAAGRTFADIEAEMTEVAMREVIQDEEQLIITGNSSTNPLAFDGLKTQVTTNTQDENNGASPDPILILNKAIQKVLAYGVRPTAIYCGFGFQALLNTSLAAKSSVILQSGNEVSAGVMITGFQSQVGILPLIPTFAIAATAESSNFVEDVYVVTEQTAGQSILYMEDLIPLGKSPLARTGTAVPFMVTEATVFVNRAQELHCRIIDVRVA